MRDGYERRYKIQQLGNVKKRKPGLNLTEIEMKCIVLYCRNCQAVMSQRVTAYHT
jgi:hypothetical protein